MFKPQTSLVSNKRLGFTLVELMIVISIIVILVSLSAGGVFKFLSYQKQVATDRTKEQVKAAIERVLNNIRTKAHTDYASVSTNNNSLSSVLRLIGQNLQSANLIGIREPNRRDELVFVDLQIGRSFPLNFDNINGVNKITVAFIPVVNVANQAGINGSFNSAMPLNLATSLNVIPSITQAFIGITPIPSLPRNPLLPVDSEIAARENSACLLMALEANPDGLKGELLGTAVTTDPVTKARYITTADGQPIGFQLKYLDSQSSGSKSVVGTVTVELIDP